MAKRKASGAEDAEVSDKADPMAEESSSDEEMDMLQVDFEWFDPQPKYDFEGIKVLLRQLLDVDAQLFDLSSLSDLVLAQPLLGSTVKVDGNETDPYAFVTVINLKEHQKQPTVKTLTDYMSAKSAQVDSLNALPKLLDSGSGSQVGLILTERLINVPSEVVPPMYKMLVEEISWAVEEKEPYNFTHYLIFSKAYHEVASTLDDGEDAGKNKHKKQKKENDQVESDLLYFHPEDQILHKFAEAYGSFDYTKEAGESDSKRAFQELGIKPCAHVILIKASQFEPAVKAVQQAFGQG